MPILFPTCLDALFLPCASLILLRHPFAQSILGGTGFSTSCPSPTPFGLGLGPGLPWADEPSPGILRFTADRILTCLLAYLCQHSHFFSVHCSFRYSFSQKRTLPYHLKVLTFQIQSFGIMLSPVTFSAQLHLTSELLRILLMMAASKPTSWLSLRLYFLFHLAYILGP